MEQIAKEKILEIALGGCMTLGLMLGLSFLAIADVIANKIHRRFEAKKGELNKEYREASDRLFKAADLQLRRNAKAISFLEMMASAEAKNYTTAQMQEYMRRAVKMIRGSDDSGRLTSEQIKAMNDPGGA